MDKKIKASIGKMAFSLDAAAYTKLEEYLGELSAHYEGKAGGKDIVSGIEERIAEILTERGFKDKTVTESAIDEIIFTLGTADDIDGGDPSQENGKKIRRRLYRDTGNRIIAGVCSGLGNYFNIDPIIFRLVFAVTGIACLFSDWEALWILLLLYPVLCIIMPAARTSAQKCEMYGRKQSIRGIEESIENGRHDSGRQDGFGKTAGRIFTFLIGLILFCIGVSGITATILLLFGISIWSIAIPAGLAGWISAFGCISRGTAILAEVFLGLSVSLIFIGMTYGGVMMLFGLRSPKWKPGLIIFAMWLLSVIGLAAIVTISSVRQPVFRDSIAVGKSESLPRRDTLYIELAGSGQWKSEKAVIDADRNEFNIMFFKEGKEPEIIFYPKIRLSQSDRYRAATEIFVSTEGLRRRPASLADFGNGGNMDFYSIKGDTLVLKPQIISKEKALTDIDRMVRIRTDEDVTVIIPEPVRHQFDRSLEFSSFGYLLTDIF